MKKILLWAHMLPQNLLGLIVVKLAKAKIVNDKETPSYYATDKRIGVSLGFYRIIMRNSSKETILHEYGHTLQSVRLGWLYLLVIGIPSACGNLYDMLFHGNWTSSKRLEWYYSQPWEKWANKLGEVQK